MANLKNVIYLSNEDYETLISTGTVTIDGETLTYDENNLYITPNALASSTEDGLMCAEDKIKLDSIQPEAYITKAENVTYSGLKTLRDNSNLVPGKQYRIIDYQCTTTQSNTQSANHQFDIIVVADDEKTLDENARAILHEEDIYFANSDLNAWEIKYSLDNDSSKFAWADSTNGKGVIYHMKDEFNNECPYDFKNIQFYKLYEPSVQCMTQYDFETVFVRQSESDIEINGENYYAFYSSAGGPPYEHTIYFKTLNITTSSIIYNSQGEQLTTSSTYYVQSFDNGVLWLYTFTYTENSELKDASILGLTKSCYNNRIKEYYNENKLHLNWTIFYSTSTIFDCFNNTFEYGSYSNTFGDNCSNNTFGNGCYNNSFAAGCSNNTFGGECRENTFEGRCSNNTFENYCHHNTFGYNCYSNTFGDNCYSNTCGARCYSNTFGNYCHNNKFGSVCYSNTFGNDCILNTFGSNLSNNTFGNGCQYVTFGTADGAINYCRYIILDNCCSHLYINSTDTGASSSNYLQNVHIHLGVSGSSSENRLTITVPDRELKYETNYYLDDLGNLTNSNDLTKITWQKLVDLRDSGTLVPGKQYRITDYITTTTQSNTSSAGHQFDIIVTADSENTLNENARAVLHEGDTYFAECNLGAWQLKYCIDNDTIRFAWANDTNGKGVIYWLKDEWDNECPYDFKNIIYDFKKSFKVYTYYGSSYYGYYESANETIVINETTYYKNNRISYAYGPWTPPTEIWTTTTTFSSDMAIYSKSNDTTMTPLSYTVFDVMSDSYSTYTFNYDYDSDASIEGLSTGCYNNVIKEYYFSNKLQLNWNIFYSTDTHLSCYSNTFGNNCYNNTFENSCYGNIFGVHCYENTFGNECQGNIFGDDCRGHKFGNSCSNNTFGNNSFANKFGNSCSSNAFGNEYQNNTFGNYCSNNTFGDYCFRNTFGNQWRYNTVGNSCQDNTFGTASGTIDHCRYNIIDNGCKYLYINSTDTGASSVNCLQNVHIHLGVCGSSPDGLTITVPDRDLEYEYNVIKAGTTTVEV